jgi:CO dehydrogenase/acetyl-CoA synthase alpha subunit
MAGPDRYYMMINGQMMIVTPMTKDVTLKNGCKVCAAGTLTDAKGKTVNLKSGDIVSAEGVMNPAANHAHGG